MSVCHSLLQLWSWEHFLIGQPKIADPIHPYARGRCEIDSPTMGTRWTCARKLTWDSVPQARRYPKYHREFESLEEHNVVWFPWHKNEQMKVAPLGNSIQCIIDFQYWKTTCHLVFSHMVEPYKPYRVMRQFNLFQTVPPPNFPDLPRKVHE